MNNTKQGTLYLIPAKLGESSYGSVFPELNKKIILSIKIFVIEDIKSARRFLKSLKYPGNFDDVTFHTLNEHTKEQDTIHYLNEIKKGYDVGILSEAGMPCIADPGNIVVQQAHKKNYKVTSLIGPSSLFLSLAASGFNGQHFTFCGYLPIQEHERTRRIKNLEKKAWFDNQTQIFIETPYRNLKLFESLLKSCKAETLLCIACDLTLDSEYIKTLSISQWKKINPPIHKKPVVFLLSKNH